MPRMVQSRSVLYFAASALLLLSLRLPGGVGTARAQGDRGAKASTSAKASAVIDMTGYWVAIVNEDWRWRMLTPAKGDYSSLPLNAEGHRVADTWDPAKDERDGNQCRAYGAANIMRIPERLHITWADDNTLQMETDAGMQKRQFHFGGPRWQGGQTQWQGDSVARWEKQVQYGGDAAYGGPSPGKGGDLEVITTHMRPGYLRKNGVPYSENAVLTEYYNIFYPEGPQGTVYMTVTSAIDDPKYLSETYVTSGQFRREPDGAKWDPTPCRPLWPLRALLPPVGWNENGPSK
ncbi:MAG: hypothetical protein ABSA57_12220 [Candidatus Acidiferrales bacterium]